MLIPLPRPGEVIGRTRSAVDQAVGSAASLASLPARAIGLLDEVAALLARINRVVDRIEETLDRSDRVLVRAEAAVDEVAVISAAATAAIDNATDVALTAGSLVERAQQVAASVDVVVETARGAADTAGELLAAYAPGLRQAAPMAQRFIEHLHHEEVTAAIRMIDELPRLRQHLTSDIMPILATLDRVGPDLHDLLAVTRDLRLAVAGIPGLGILRRRGENRLADEIDEIDGADKAP